jgi:hypothetical protein
MATAIFATQPGYALAVKDSAAAPLTIGLTDWGDIASGGGFANMGAIITSIGVREGANYQLQHTLRKFVYAFTFGDRSGDLAISGIAFAGNCDGGAAGVDRVHSYYRSHRISSRARPVGVAIGGSAFPSLLVEGGINIDNPQAGLAMFSLTFKTIPET